MSKTRILIVEDEKIIALDLQRRIERFGYQVIGVVSNYEDAVASAAESDPDIILMDIILGGERDGVDAALTIRERRNIPIVFLTAHADAQMVEYAKKADPFGYVLKPFKEDDLQATLEIAIYRSRLDSKLHAERELFSAVLASISDGLIAFDENCSLRFVNPVAERLTGIGFKTHSGSEVCATFSVFDDVTEHSVPLDFERVQNAGIVNFSNVHLKTASDGRIHIRGKITPVHFVDGTVGGLIVFQDVTKLREMKQTIQHQASHDLLTGLHNRDEFLRILREVVAGTVLPMQVHTLVCFDIDHFKVVNDVCGHVAGDDLLQQISHDLKSYLDVRPIKTAVARLGDDEFGVLFLDTQPTEATVIAVEVLERIHRRFAWQLNSFIVTASAGLVPVTVADSDAHALLTAADDAAYLARYEDGGNTVRVYEQADQSFRQRRGEMQWISKLNDALEENRFVLFTQPIVPTAEVALERHEVLLRLQSSDGGLLSPGEFIPAAEKYDLMPLIDQWVIRNAFNALMKLAERGERPIFTINLSAASLSDPSLMDQITRAIDETGVDSRQVCIEITETSAIQHMGRTASLIETLSRQGLTFALDDFGNGFSSFSYLKNLPVDYLKIDGSFVQTIETDATDLALVEVVNKIGHVMGMQTVAEFVHNATVRDMLLDIGVDFLQGHYIAQPQPLQW